MNLEHDDRLTRYLLACGLAPAAFAAINTAEGAVRPGYHALHRFSSELSLGDYGWVQVTNFIVTGALVLSFAVGLRRALRTGRGSIAAPILTGTFGLSLLLAGIFVTDPKPGHPPGTSDTAGTGTPHGMIHDLSGLLMIIAMTATMFVLVARFAGEPVRRGWMWYSLASGVLVPVSFILMAVLFGRASAAGTTDAAYHGLAQRFTLVCGFVWFSAIALLFLREWYRVARPALSRQPEGFNRELV